ncbi:MAG TPA: HAMP domain-containing sensor histidine kinase, partial [Polyangiales bacterium]|nr:HAMP domain-containing sensor histidine kinase [Polyangiales bacterium]
EAKHEALLRLQRQKDEMAALLAHDLRSPASGIMLSCKAQLRKPQLTASDRRYWSNILAGAEAISRMASNLIDVARGEESGLQANKHAFDLNAMLEETVEIMSSLALGREQRLELQTAPAGTTLTGDRELLRRVLQNLLDNAFRFHSGEAPVRLEARRLDAAIELRVADAGPGIPEAKRDTVFDKYARLGPSRAGEASAGHGLGLTFCRLAAECHGGSIGIEPNQPRGSVFVLRLPVH